MYLDIDHVYLWIGESYISRASKLETSKEPDGAVFANAPDVDTLPSIIVEVGFSETLGKLMWDARWWMEKATNHVVCDGKVRALVIIL